MNTKGKPQAAAKKTFEEVVGDAQITEEEKRALDRAAQISGKLMDAIEPEEDARPAGLHDMPDWALPVPEGLRLPAGKQIIPVRFRADWTDKPGLGERQCLLWNLTDADEKLAAKRTRGEHTRSMDELAKAMIRGIDGQKADWTGMPGRLNVDQFWDDIGGTCRGQIKALYYKRHSLKTEEMIDFLANCVAVVTVNG
jgi:hypothetical protein